MIDVKKVKARMTLLGIHYKDIANIWSCAPQTAYQKITGRRKITLKEANQLASMLHFTEKEYYEFFFAHEIA